jgi:hypothetical protein
LGGRRRGTRGCSSTAPAARCRPLVRRYRRRPLAQLPKGKQNERDTDKAIEETRECVDLY